MMLARPTRVTGAAVAAGTTMDPQAPRSIGTIGSSGSNQDQPQQSPVVPPYTLTTIITTTPLAPGRMCNVLGKQAVGGGPKGLLLLLHREINTQRCFWSDQYFHNWFHLLCVLVNI